MSTNPVLSALSSHRMAFLVRGANSRIIYLAPGIQKEVACALAERAGELVPLSIVVSLDFDERTLRMGYGSLEAVKLLNNVGLQPLHSPGIRSGILIVDERGWVFTPTPLYLEAEPQSDETPNAVQLGPSQVQALAVRFSPAERKAAVETATTPEEAEELEQLPLELGVIPVSESHLEEVTKAIETAPPVEFDVVRQVRVFEPYLQYVEISLTGAALQRRRVQIPKSLQKIGASAELEKRLRTTFDLIEKGGELSSKPLEDELRKVRDNLTRVLPNGHGRVVLKSAKALLAERIAEIQAKLTDHQEKVKAELQGKIDESRKQVVDYYLPLVIANPPDALLGSLLNPATDEDGVRSWIDGQLASAFPTADQLIQNMTLEERYKDVTYETLNRDDFLESVKKAYPEINWEKAYNEFKAAGEKKQREPEPR